MTENAPPALDKISAALAANDVQMAVDLAREALARGGRHPLLFNLRAYWFEQQGRNREALADLRQAQALAPDDPIVLNALGLACARADLPQEARDRFRAALERDPRFAPAHFNHGWASEDLGDLDAARASFQEHARLAPDSPDPWGRLAALSARLGDWPNARAQANRALSLDSEHTAAKLALASCAAAEGDFESASRLLNDVLAGPRTSALERGIALGQKGDLFHARKDYDAAFQSYTAGNREIRAIHAARFAGPGVETIPQFLAWLERTFAQTPPWASAPMPEKSPAAGHVFIVGFPRSGTTLLEDALAAHAGVITTGERDGLADSVMAFLGSPDRLDRFRTAPAAVLEEYRTAYWRRLADQGIDPQGRILIDKQPYNTMKLPLIARLFPGARVIFAVRDPRDVVLSCYRRRFRMNPSNFELLTLEGGADFYASTMRLAEMFAAKLPLATMNVRHEYLIEDLPAQLRAICGFCEIPWSDALLTFAERRRERSIATPSAAQIARGINRDGMGQWRHYARHLEGVLPVLAPWLAHFGYAP